MGRRRKTFDIVELLYTVNTRNTRSTCDPKVREGWNAILEHVLLGADVYSGYGYVRATDLPWGEAPGIRYTFIADGSPALAEEYFAGLEAERKSMDESRYPTPNPVKQEFPDESRRTYYVHQSLRKAYGNITDRERRKALREHRARR
jgi:hypothetical protein